MDDEAELEVATIDKKAASTCCWCLGASVRRVRNFWEHVSPMIEGLLPDIDDGYEDLYISTG